MLGTMETTKKEARAQKPFPDGAGEVISAAPVRIANPLAQQHGYGQCEEPWEGGEEGGEEGHRSGRLALCDGFALAAVQRVEQDRLLVAGILAAPLLQLRNGGRA